MPLCLHTRGGRYPVQSITLNRVEGPNWDLGKAVVGSFAEADRVLRAWSETAPGPGKGYHKVDFTVRWAHDMEYKGRFDLKAEHRPKGDLLQNQIRRELCLIGGRWKPSHWSAEEAATYRSRFSDAQRLLARDMMELVEL